MQNCTISASSVTGVLFASFEMSFPIIATCIVVLSAAQLVSLAGALVSIPLLLNSFLTLRGTFPPLGKLPRYSEAVLCNHFKKLKYTSVALIFNALLKPKVLYHCHGTRPWYDKATL